MRDTLAEDSVTIPPASWPALMVAETPALLTWRFNQIAYRDSMTDAFGPNGTCNCPLGDAVPFWRAPRNNYLRMPSLWITFWYRSEL